MIKKGGGPIEGTPEVEVERRRKHIHYWPGNWVCACGVNLPEAYVAQSERVRTLEMELAAAFHKKPVNHEPAICPICTEAEEG